MASLSRRRVLGLGGAALVAGSGCLAARGATADSVDIVSINHTESTRDVSVRLEAPDGRELFRQTVRLRGGDVHRESRPLDADAVTVRATLARNPFYEAEETVDVRACAASRLVVVVRPGPRLAIEREDGRC